MSPAPAGAEPLQASLAELAGRRRAELLPLRPSLPRLAWESYAASRAATGSPLASDPAAWRASVLAASTSLTLLAGSGTRWVRSLAAAQARGEHVGLDPERPRGLFPLRDLLGRGGGRIPVAAYSLRAVRSLGSHVIVVRGFEEAIESEILEPLGILPGSRRFATQEAPFGKPLGHGDAAWQCRALWREAEYVVANFGGDANSRHTVESSLLALAALRAAGEEVDLLIPAARLPGAAYPIALDPEGIPRRFGHAKLQGSRAGEGGEGEAGLSTEESWTNVGLRIYRAAALAAVLEELHDRYWEEGSGYAVPSNDPSGRELALDNADAFLARAGRARILGMALPRELTPAKSLDEVPAFEEAMAAVIAEERELGYRD